MIVAAALCPHPPLLLPGVAGSGDVAPDLRAACRAAVVRLLAARPDVVHVVGADGPPVGPASFGVPVTDDAQAPARPLALLVGASLLAEAGWHGPTRFRPVDPALPPAECAAVGRRLDGAGEPVALLVLGDGSARRGPRAPGYVDDRARGFDDAVLGALRAGDTRALLELDPALATDLLAAGRAGWQVLAGAIAGRRDRRGDVLYAGDPFGVQYVVGVWNR